MQNAQFTKQIIRADIMQDNPLGLMDIGALGGISDRWQALCDCIRIIAFDPLENPGADHFKRNGSIRVYPMAIGEKQERRKFYITVNPGLSSFLEVKQEWKNRTCVFNEGAEVSREVELDLISLDSFCQNHNIQGIDFLKVDTEGTELQIFQGAESTLENLIGIEVEVFFHKTHHHRCVFADIDNYLRSKGFVLYDIRTWRYSRLTLPQLDPPRCHASPYGQIMGGDALYLRDPVGNNHHKLNVQQILKLIILCELYELPDCAIEFLEWGVQNHLFPNELLCMRNLLVPDVLGRRIDLTAYRKLSELFR